MVKEFRRKAASHAGEFFYAGKFNVTLDCVYTGMKPTWLYSRWCWWTLLSEGEVHDTVRLLAVALSSSMSSGGWNVLTVVVTSSDHASVGAAASLNAETFHTRQQCCYSFHRTFTSSNTTLIRANKARRFILNTIFEACETKLIVLKPTHSCAPCFFSVAITVDSVKSFG